jgi:hypothetical protein
LQKTFSKGHLGLYSFRQREDEDVGVGVGMAEYYIRVVTTSTLWKSRY